jgi:hypothetical protein
MNGWHNRLKPNDDYQNTDTIRQQIDWHVIANDAITIVSLSRLEERKNYAEPQWALRLRERLVVRIPFKSWKNHSFVTFDEVFLDLNNPAWINSNSLFGQNRAFIGIGTQLSKFVGFDIGYLNQFETKTTGNQVNNVLYLIFNVALP